MKHKIQRHHAKQYHRASKHHLKAHSSVASYYVAINMIIDKVIMHFNTDQTDTEIYIALYKGTDRQYRYTMMDYLLVDYQTVC